VRTIEITVETIDRSQVLKTLGYGASSPPGDFMLSRTDEIIAGVPTTLKACCKTAGITGKEEGIVLTDQGAIKSHAFGELAESADMAVFSLVTAGSGMDALIEGCEDTVDAMILDAVGSVLADQGVESFRKILENRLGKHLSLPFSPGYCDYPLKEQQTVFNALGSNPLGVQIHPDSFMMTPIKTISFVCAAGEIPLETNPCVFCQLDTCQMKRN
jgi:hypothetical protein